MNGHQTEKGLQNVLCHTGHPPWNLPNAHSQLRTGRNKK